MARAKVALYGVGQQRVARIETDATIGATVGTDLFWPDGTVVQVSDLTGLAAALPPATGIALDDVQMLGPQSVVVSGSMAQGSISLALVNDSASPSGLSFYGTNSSGVKGYQPLAWGSITGTLSSQTDLQAALNAKVTGTGDTDPAMAADSATRVPMQSAVVTAIGAGAAATQRMMAQLYSQVQDASILFIGDSTGNDSNEWIDLLTNMLAADWPAWTVKYALWNDTSGSYPTPTVRTTGTGPRTLTIWNASVAGFTTQSWLGSRFPAAIAAVLPMPTMVVITLGKNEGASNVLWHCRYLGLSESVTEAFPEADLLMILQNPNVANTLQQQRAYDYRSIATRRGYGLVDVGQAFLNTDPTLLSLTLPDGIHPNPTGSALWAATVHACFVRVPFAPLRSQAPSTLSSAGEQLATNGSFASFSGTVPDGFVAFGSPTVAKDKTNYESANGYAVKVTAAGGVAGYLQQNLPISRCAGRWITMLVRVYVGTGQPATAGRFGIVDSTGSTLSSLTESFGGYKWALVDRFIPAAASYIRLYLYGDSSTTGGAASFDSVVVVFGRYPRRGATGTPGLQGPVGTIAGTLDFESSMGHDPFSVMALIGGQQTMALANASILVEYRPARNITVNALTWFTGAAVSGNYDIGIYSATGTVLWSKGSTAAPAANTSKQVTVPNIALTAGTKYFLALAIDNTTMQFRGNTEVFVGEIMSSTGVQFLQSYPANFPLANVTVANNRAGKCPCIIVQGT